MEHCNLHTLASQSFTFLLKGEARLLEQCNPQVSLHSRRANHAAPGYRCNAAAKSQTAIQAAFPWSVLYMQVGKAAGR